MSNFSARQTSCPSARLHASKLPAEPPHARSPPPRTAAPARTSAGTGSRMPASPASNRVRQCLGGKKPGRPLPPPCKQARTLTRRTAAFLASAVGCGVAAEKSPFPANLVRQVTHRQPRRRQPGPASVWTQFSKHLSKLNEYRLRRVRGSPRPIRSHFAKYKASQSGISLPSSHSLPSQIVAMGTATERQLINTIISP